ncbi:MAG: ACP phosphodiesterase [Halieaceae bacterium]|jgi:acyl carrier protein phosphodiesterase|nr:ACP phosphodiesterase [Halieaceae bacterium]
MNYLAHFHLAWPDENLIVGGLEGEFFKGPLPGKLTPCLQAGVRLHRAIDGFTDRHPTLAGARAAFPAGSRRYAGILMDLAFDYFLSRHWSRFSDIPLDAFSEHIYQTLTERESSLSPAGQRMAQRLREYRVLTVYRNWEAVPETAARLGGRLRRANPLQDSQRLLEPLRDKLEQSFLSFYPALQQFSKETGKLVQADRVTIHTP